MRPVPSWPFLSPVSRSFAREGEREALRRREAAGEEGRETKDPWTRNTPLGWKEVNRRSLPRSPALGRVCSLS